MYIYLYVDNIQLIYIQYIQIYIQKDNIQLIICWQIKLLNYNTFPFHLLWSILPVIYHCTSNTIFWGEKDSKMQALRDTFESKYSSSTKHMINHIFHAEHIFFSPCGGASCLMVHRETYFTFNPINLIGYTTITYLSDFLSWKWSIIYLTPSL